MLKLADSRENEALIRKERDREREAERKKHNERERERQTDRQWKRRRKCKREKRARETALEGKKKDRRDRENKERWLTSISLPTIFQHAQRDRHIYSAYTYLYANSFNPLQYSLPKPLWIYQWRNTT